MLDYLRFFGTNNRQKKDHFLIYERDLLNEVELSEIRFEVRNIVTTVCNNLSILEDEFATILDSRVLGAFAGRLISIEGLWSSSFSWDKINSNDLEKIHNLLELFDLEENCEVILKKIIYYKY